MTITLTNDVHNTQATLRVAGAGQYLSTRQQQRAEKALCGMDCTCGVIRGPQDGIPDGWELRTDWGDEWYIGPAEA